MKLIIHAGLFAMGTLEIDTETREHRFLTDPLINADQSITTTTAERIDPKSAMEGAQVALAVLNQAVSFWMLKRAGIDAKVVAPKEEPIPLTNVLGGNGKASA